MVKLTVGCDFTNKNIGNVKATGAGKSRVATFHRFIFHIFMFFPIAFHVLFFFCQSKNRWRTEFVKIFVIQFCPHSATNLTFEIFPICGVKFAILIFCWLNAICQKSFLSCLWEKANHVCWWNRPPVASGNFSHVK